MFYMTYMYKRRSGWGLQKREKWASSVEKGKKKTKNRGQNKKPKKKIKNRK